MVKVHGYRWSKCMLTDGQNARLQMVKVHAYRWSKCTLTDGQSARLQMVKVHAYRWSKLGLIQVKRGSLDCAVVAEQIHKSNSWVRFLTCDEPEVWNSTILFRKYLVTQPENLHSWRSGFEVFFVFYFFNSYSLHATLPECLSLSWLA